MNNDDLKAFGQTVVLGRYEANNPIQTLEIGGTDKNGNKHPDHEAYEAEMDKRGDGTNVNLDRPF